MKTNRFILSFLIFPILFPAAWANGAQVQGSEGTIDIPTYALGEEDPNPAFPLINRHQIYPYTMMDDLTDRREVQTYRAISLENEYLKAIILPEVGGRLYSLYDKVAKREVFYRNNVVKYGLVSLRGAWISGGIEFNFPNGHTVVTVSQVASRLVSNADGSATAMVGGMDWVTEMHWEVALTLRPRQARLEQRVTLFNSTPLDNLYWYWANAAVPATRDMQFIYPMREANPHSRSEIWSYPVWEGVDYSWYKNFRQPTSLFGLAVRRNFFGAYYHDSDFGVVHVADYHDVPGKKIWSWGVASDGLIWTDLLTDRDGAYNEIQSGRYETQLNQEFMPPQRIESWTEYWYPVHGLGGGFVEATDEFALNVKFVEASGKQSAHCVLAINPTVENSGIKVLTTLDGKVLREFGPLSFEPQKPVVLEIPVNGVPKARKSLAVEIKDATSRSLLHWSAADPVDGNPDFVPSARAHKVVPKPIGQMTVEELYLRGVEQEKNGDPEGAIRTYKQVLRRNSGYVPALLKLARCDYAAADLVAAQQKVDAALAQSHDDPAVQYAAGIVHRAAGRWAAAESAFSASLQALGPSAPALVQLGEISIHEKKYDEAARRLREALKISSGNALATADLAVALRLAGKPAEAAPEADKALELMPLLPFALVEKWRDLSAAAKEGSSSSNNSWKNVLNFDVQNYLEVAAWYRGLGDRDSSEAMLEEAVKDFPEEKISPLVFYYLAENAREAGNSDRADELLAKAVAAPSEKVFPQRFSDAQVLSDALSHHPDDAKAHYYLGTFLFAHDRFEDAAKEWQAARSAGLESPVLYRDLAVSEWRVKKNLPQAARYYEQAIRLAPTQYRYYPELDEIYAQLGETSKRNLLFAQAPREVLDRDTVRVRRALLFAQEGEFAKALALFNDHAFKPWEGGAIVRQIFVLANLSEGRTLLSAKKPAEAEQAFRRALEYPVNLGVGKPDRPHDEEAWYWLGTALAAEGKKTEAREAWNNAAKEGSKADGISAVYAGGALMKLDRAEEAAKILDPVRGVANKPDANARSLYIAGLAERLLDHEPAAQKNFRRALDLDPSMWQARFELDRSAKAAPGR